MPTNIFFKNYKKIYLNIFIIFNIIASLIFFFEKKYIGDLKFYHSLSFKEYFLYVISYFFLIWLFKIAIDSFYKVKIIKFKLNYKYLDFLVLLLLLIRLSLLFILGYGKVTGNVRIPGGTILVNLFPVEYFFYFFYCLRRESKLFLINLVLFAILQIFMGWTYFIFILGIFELCLRIKKKVNPTKIVLVIILGIFSYSFFTPLKHSIRYSKVYKIEKNFIFTSTQKLVARFSTFSNFVFVNENKNEISIIMKERNEKLINNLKEYYSLILPKKKMKLDNYETLNHLIPNYFNNLDKELQGKISYDVTLYGRILLMFLYLTNIEVLLFISFIFANIFITIYLTKIYKSEYLKAITYINLWLLFFSGNLQSFFKFQYSILIFTLLSFFIGILNKE